MKRVKSRWVLTVALGMGLGFAAPVFAKELEGIPLVWKSTTQIGEAGAIDLTGIQQTKIQVNGLTDSRESTNLIGENREEDRARKVTTSDNVATWCTSRLKTLLGQFGLDVVDSDGDVIVRGEIKRFFVAETSTYEGDVGLKIEVVSKDGKTLWSGMAGGTATRFGRSYKADNYYEALSDSLVDAVENLVKNGGFRAALRRP